MNGYLNANEVFQLPKEFLICSRDLLVSKKIRY